MDTVPRFQYPCYVDVCTFPIQYCNSDRNERQCSPCTTDICELERKPLGCQYYCMKRQENGDGLYSNPEVQNGMNTQQNVSGFVDNRDLLTVTLFFTLTTCLVLLTYVIFNILRKNGCIGQEKDLNSKDKNKIQQESTEGTDHSEPSYGKNTKSTTGVGCSCDCTSCLQSNPATRSQAAITATSRAGNNHQHSALLTGPAGATTQGQNDDSPPPSYQTNDQIGQGGRTTTNIVKAEKITNRRRSKLMTHTEGTSENNQPSTSSADQNIQTLPNNTNQPSFGEYQKITKREDLKEFVRSTSSSSGDAVVIEVEEQPEDDNITEQTPLKTK